MIKAAISKMTALQKFPNHIPSRYEAVFMSTGSQNWDFGRQETNYSKLSCHLNVSHQQSYSKLHVTCFLRFLRVLLIDQNT